MICKVSSQSCRWLKNYRYLSNLQTRISSTLYIIYQMVYCRFTVGIIISLCYDFQKSLVPIFRRPMLVLLALTLYCIMLKNGQTYFKNLAV